MEIQYLEACYDCYIGLYVWIIFRQYWSSKNSSEQRQILFNTHKHEICILYESYATTCTTTFSMSSFPLSLSPLTLSCIKTLWHHLKLAVYTLLHHIVLDLHHIILSYISATLFCNRYSNVPHHPKLDVLATTYQSLPSPINFHQHQ